MGIRLEDTVHGIELEVGTLIKVDILSKDEDECIGYYKGITNDGIFICPSQKACFSKESQFNILIPMEDIARVYRVGRIATISLEVKRYADTQQISK
jgi:hypothetical protein